MVDVKEVKDLSIFAGMEDDEINEILCTCNTRELKEKDILFHQGDRGDKMYILLNGEVEVLLYSNGELTRITTLGEGSVIGELAVLTSENRTATIRATKDSSLLMINKINYKRLIAQRHPGALKMAYNIAIILAKRLQMMDRTFVQVMKNLGRKNELYEYRKRSFTEWDF